MAGLLTKTFGSEMRRSPREKILSNQVSGEESSDQTKLVSFSIRPKQASKPKIELKKEMKLLKAALKSERTKEEQREESKRSHSNQVKLPQKPISLKQSRKPSIKRHF